MRRALFLVSFLAVFTPTAHAGDDAEVLFATVVQPVLKTRCLACHGEDPDKLKAGFDLTSRATLLRVCATGPT